jgi:hypothetical protein
VKSKSTIYVLLVAALIVFVRILWVHQHRDSYQSYQSYQGRAILQTSGTNTPEVAVPLEANVQPTVIVTPADILLPPGPLPNGLMIAIAIQNNSGTNILTLSEPTLNIPGVGIEITTNQPGQSYSVMLGFPQGFVVLPGRQVEFRVKTSDPKVPVIRMPVKQMSR